jgi:hypothetical protein
MMKQDNHEFKAAWATQQAPISKTEKRQRQQILDSSKREVVHIQSSSLRLAADFSL